MNILFVLYGDFTSNSAYPLALYARELHRSGHSCVVAVPKNIETVKQLPRVSFLPLLYADVLNDPEAVFSDGRPADVIHAWTPRENVRHFVAAYMAKRLTPLIVYLEDHESWISCRALGLEEATLAQQTDQSISERLPDALSHPFRYDSFIGLADAVAVIQDKLAIEVPPWVHCATVMPSVDLKFFSPRLANPLLRKQYGVAENEWVIVYPGGVNGFTKPAIETLCNAVGLINAQGYPCKLLRTGPFALDFLDQLPAGVAAVINDLGVLPRSELPNLLALADVFVQPGKIDPFEDLRLPGKLPELLAMGRPVVMPDVNIAHLFTDGVNAVLTRTGTAEEIAAKCIGLFSDPQLADRIGQGGRLFAENHFEIKKQTRLLMDVYKIACDNFKPIIAKEVWQFKDEDSPVTLLLATKLNLLADLQSVKYSNEEVKMLRCYASQIELMQLRVSGLEVACVTEREEHNARLSQTVAEKDQHIINLDQVIEAQIEQNTRLSQTVAEKDQHIVNLDQVIAEREQQIANLNQVVTEIRGSTSWRLTSPIRLVGLQVVRIKIILNAIPYALSMCGGYSGLVKHVHRSYKKEGIKGIKRRVLFSAAPGASPPVIDYEQPKLSEYGEWVLSYDTLSNEDRKKIKTRISQFQSLPLISVLMPVYNPPLDMLEEAIRSVQTQLYQNWELCIADDASTNSKVRKVLKRYAANDARIKVIFRKENGHISASSNSALELVTGDYLALLDNDDLLPEQALFWIADAIVANPNAGLLYSDEDKIDTAGQRYDPYFKPDWNPDLFLSHNMICHLGVYRTELVRKLGGFREGYEGAQDYDLALRCTAQLTAQQIVHIPRVLYHWRSHPGSTAQAGSEKNYALTAGERSLNDHFLRINVKAKAKLTNFGMYRVYYTLPAKAPLVSFVIPTYNGLDLLKQCIDSILTKTTYKNYEILIVDNNSDCSKALAYFARIVKNKKIRVLRDQRPFNYSALNNAAIKQAKGKYVALINNDIEVISPEWLIEMLSIAIQPGVGAVGARLLYPNDTLQHGGVVTGLGGVAGHSHKHLHKSAPGYFYRSQLIQTYSAVTAACLVIKKSIFHEVGGLNEENLAIAFNDVDFCLRVREAGYRNVWTPYAELYHHESATRGFEDTPEKQLRFTKEVLYMKKRWGDELMNDPAYNPNLTLDREDFSYAWPPRTPKI